MCSCSVVMITLQQWWSNQWFQTLTLESKMSSNKIFTILINTVDTNLYYKNKGPVQVQTQSEPKVQSTHHLDLALQNWVRSTLALAWTLGTMGSVRSGPGLRGPGLDPGQSRYDIWFLGPLIKILQTLHMCKGTFVYMRFARRRLKHVCQ